MRQLQTWLCLKTGHRPGGQDLLRKLSQVYPREGEVLHSWAIKKCGAWLLAEGQRCQGWCVEQVGVCSLVSFPLTELIWQLQKDTSWCPVPLLEAAHHSQLSTFCCSYVLKKKSSSYDQRLQRCTTCKMDLSFDLKDIVVGTMSLMRENICCKICTLGTDLNLLFPGLKVWGLEYLFMNCIHLLGPWKIFKVLVPSTPPPFFFFFSLLILKVVGLEYPGESYDIT